MEASQITCNNKTRHRPFHRSVPSKTRIESISLTARIARKLKVCWRNFKYGQYTYCKYQKWTTVRRICKFSSIFGTLDAENPIFGTLGAEYGHMAFILFFLLFAVPFSSPEVGNVLQVAIFVTLDIC